MPMEEADLLRKISGLLAKAEGTDNPNESKAFFEGAHRLMVTYAIDEERARAAGRAAHRLTDEPVVEDYMFSTYAHHAQAKLNLLTMVAKAQSVRMYPYGNRKDSNLHREGNRGLHESQWTKFVGYASDISHVKMLYLSLLIQSQKFAQEDWQRLYGNAKHSSWEDGHMGKFAWMSAHMDGFADQIGDRFRELTQSIYRSTAGANALIQDKDANILEWMYEHGIARRPSPPSYRCWTAEPESNRPFNSDGRTKSKRWEPAYCIKMLPAKDVPHEGEHAFTHRAAKMTFSSYSPKGRSESREGRNAGRSAAERADIGLTQVGNTPRLRG